ncbi:hypothetical protein QQG74_09355 [Micromonospora sp. FIMYZ51]|uniref:hypothetical protein n=1 Tax=Micromonospora sp. FIMYZ51 TaxID=3051832 RepID=UPI00311E9FB7
MSDLRAANRRDAAARDLHRLLYAATYQRDSRWDVVDTRDGPETGWVVYERQVMHTAVNEIRANNGLPPVDMEVIEQADNGAAGRSDWMDRFVLRCAALAVGEEWRG